MLIKPQYFWQRLLLDSDGAAAGGAATTDDTEPNADGMFDKATVEKMIQKRVAKMKQEQDTLRKENEKTLAQLETLRTSANLTKKQKEELADQITDLEKQVYSTEELAAKREKELLDQQQSLLKTEQEKSAVWRSRFETSTIDRTLLDAATSAKAENNNQLVKMLRPDTLLVEDKDSNGNLTGVFKSVTRIQGKLEDGTIGEIELETMEAVKKLREDGLNKNLFSHNQSGGTGGSGQSDSTQPKGERPLPENYGSTEAWQQAYSEWKKDSD